jgi:hypothetical protein
VIPALSDSTDKGMVVANKKFVVKLTSEERKRLKELISKGTQE